VSPHDLPRLAVQLYTLRDSIAELTTLIPRLAADGYQGVEVFGGEFDVVDADTFAKLLADNGMVASCGHVGLDRDGLIDEQALDRLQTVGVDTAIVAFMPPDKFNDLAGVARVAEKLATAAEQIAARGMTLGYHNHFWELNLIDGRPALTELFERAGESVVAEVDIYWAKVGGVDPARCVAELGDRARFLHVKDGPADNFESDMVAVGNGTIDIPAVLAAGLGARWHIVELDRCATDMYEAVADSARYLSNLGLTDVRS
jgi:sugar phosphate isomerase/epimerase